MRKVINKIPEKRKAEFIEKVKKLLIPFSIEIEKEEDFYLEKAEELYLSELIM